MHASPSRSGPRTLAAGPDPSAATRVQPGRESLILEYLPLVRRLAGRYASTDYLRAELTQAGAVGLIQAVDRFDPRRGVPFVAYAIPTITGAMRRYLRDNSRLMRRPRPGSVTRAASGGVALFGTWSEPIEERWLPAEDAGRALAAVEDRVLLGPALQTLSERDRRIIFLRFYEDRTLGQIARELHVSVARVSRLLARSLDTLRTDLGAPTPAVPRMGATGPRPAATLKLSRQVA